MNLLEKSLSRTEVIRTKQKEYPECQVWAKGQPSIVEGHKKEITEYHRQE